jgi:hypothetical protein
VISTILVIALYLTIGHVYGLAKPAVDGAMAAKQVNGGDGTFVATQAALQAQNYLGYCLIVALAFIWVPCLFKFLDCRTTAVQEAEAAERGSCCRGGHAIALALLGLSLMFTGCIGPARTDVFETVGPNETAFVIPLSGDTAGNQAKFNSAEYLNTKKVAAKRIPIPLMEKNTGRGWWEYEWIPTVTVFKVDRGLVSREWVEDANKGTRTKNEGIPVATKDSIQLTFGVAVTTYIEEDDASTYLYYHGLQKLAGVTDNNVRNFCVSELTRECGKLTLAELKDKVPAIFSKLFDDAKAYFKTKGITVSQLGNAEGYQFLNDKIQESINKSFTAEQDIRTAEQEKLAQDKRNERVLAAADTQAAAARKLFEASEATKLQNQLEIQTMQAKAALTMAEKWDGRLPANILPANSPMLMALGASSGTNAVSK